MIHVKRPVVYLVTCILLIGAHGVAAATSKNTPQCKSYLISEAERIEVELKKTVQESGDRIESIFIPENYGGDKEKALMMKGAYMAFFKKHFREPILKLHSIPGAYRQVAEMEAYPKVCDKMEKFKETNNKAILTHSQIWDKALEAAEEFKQK